MSADARERRVYLVGGGVASLAAAVFLIRDGAILGQNITILEESGSLGGSLDGSGSPEKGYVVRGGRMLESKYLCTFDLFASIPTLLGDKTVTQETLDWNEVLKTSSQSRLFRNGRRQVAPPFGLSEQHVITLERLALEPESLLGHSSIEEQFDSSFFVTDFWYMWCTTFAFQPWHSAVEFKRYLVRFAHMVGGFNRLQGILRTVYNQYDSMVRPLLKWLRQRGVQFMLGARVTDFQFREVAGRQAVSAIMYEHNAQAAALSVDEESLVLVTLGSMTEGFRLGSMETAAPLGSKGDGGAWALWERLAARGPQFGHPDVFANHVDDSKWLSFTVTLYDDTLLRLIRERTGNVPGEGGLVSFPDSRWLASIVVPHQPHFMGQPAHVGVLWGYGLNVDLEGDFVKKPMSACTGREILTELLGHLNITQEAPQILGKANCIPCMMPFITSQFLRRSPGDRPEVIPLGTHNLAIIGQFCELPDDVVFTVEYSIRSAQTAVYRLLGLERRPPAVYQGKFDLQALYRAVMALHDR
jgi:oleate hydratase